MYSQIRLVRCGIGDCYLFIYLFFQVVDINMNTIFTSRVIWKGKYSFFFVYYDKKCICIMYILSVTYMHVFLVAGNKWLIYMVLLIQ